MDKIEYFNKYEDLQCKFLTGIITSTEFAKRSRTLVITLSELKSSSTYSQGPQVKARVPGNPMWNLSTDLK